MAVIGSFKKRAFISFVNLLSIPFYEKDLGENIREGN